MPRLPGSRRGKRAMFTVSVRSELADWQEVISAPDHVLVLVECSVVDNSDRRSAHAMYGIGAEQGKFIFMNTWGRLDLRAILRQVGWRTNESNASSFPLI
mmetsp:Transcript_62590/g.204275  ORF Transcript_62590/g.204275 Transcript_62590/m.204275 type:complete len:100 (-) Transcript_62590:171-470(-)